MKPALISLISFIPLYFSAFADEKAFEDNYCLPKAAVESLSTGTEFILYSLDPGPINLQPQFPLRSEESLNGFKILGRLPLTTPKTRSIAVTAVTDAIRAADYHLLKACFRPRHALKVTANGKVFDFVICYECQTIKLYEHGVAVASIGMPNAPKPLNNLLSAAKIPLAQSDPGK